MARERYYVVFQETSGRPSTMTVTRKLSNARGGHKDAVQLAHEEGSKGHDAQVLVQGTDLLFRTEWTYGHAPCPPAG
jgi:hypothetical protein